MTLGNGEERSSRGSRSLQRRIVLGLLVVLVILTPIAVGSVLSLRSAVDEARAGRDAVGDFRDGFDLVDALDEKRADLETAQGHFAVANEHLDSTWLSITRRLPYVGTQIESAEALATGGGSAASFAVAAIDEVNLVLDGDVDDRVAVTVEIGLIAERARAALAAIDLGPATGIHSRLGEVRELFSNQLAEADADLAVVQDISRDMRTVLEGPTSYLLLVGNNAEMRGGSGSFLSAGIVTVRDGDVEVSQLSSVHDYPFERDNVLGSEPSTRLWTDITHTTDWQLLGSSPRFDWTAPLALRMWEEADGDELEGVVAVDAAVLEALLHVTGPVEVDGQTFSADDVLFEILYNQYFSVTSDNYKLYNETQIQRRDRLGVLASDSLRALEERDIDLHVLIEQLREVIAGRHLMVWSADESSSLWRALGVDGEMTEESLALSLLNAGGNKLDFWTELFAELVVDEPNGGEVAVEVRVRVVVKPPPNAPRYVVGPHPDIAEKAGDYLGVMAFNVPAAATDVAVTSDHQLRAVGVDGPTQAVLIDIAMAAGDSTDVTLEFRLPETHPPIVIEPSGRIPATRWLVGDDRWRSGAEVEILLIPSDET